MNQRHISLASDVIAIIDPVNQKQVKIFDIQSGKAGQSIDHATDIIEMELNQVDVPTERKMVFVDNNRDMFMTKVHTPELHKICNMVDSFQWNDTNDMIAALADGKQVTWFYPNAIYVDRDLMTKAMQSREANDVGKLARMISFSGNICTVRRLDGALATLPVSPYPRMLYEHIEKLDFETVIRLCRFVNENTLWATLAAMSIYCRELNTVEIALAQIDEADKVQYIDHIQQRLFSEPARQAAMLVYQKRIPEAETILLGARLFYRAIKLNIKLYRWERALDIAISNKTHVDTVIAYR